MRSLLRLTLLASPLAVLPFACTLDTAGMELSGTPPVITPGTGGAGGDAASSTDAASGVGGAGGAADGGAGGGGGTPACGDTHLDPGEQCDDGNLAGEDGCSSECMIEPAETCGKSQVALYPPGVTLLGDTSGAKHETTSIGCAAAGSNGRDYVYAVTPQVGGTLVATLTSGFAKALYARRECNGEKEPYELACEGGSGLAGFQLWVFPGVTYYIFVDGQKDGDEGAFVLDLRLYPCGDGVVQGLEQCDDPADPACVGCLACDGAGEHFETEAFATSPSRHCYYFQDEPEIDWRAARRECVARGGDLATIGSWAERQFVHSFVGEETWVGGNDLVAEGTYGWANGEPFRFADWDNGQPNNSGSEDCVFMNADGEMHDNGCDVITAFLCERVPTGGCGDGIVQGIEECDDGNNDGGDGCTGCGVDCEAGNMKDPATKHCYRYVAADLKSFEDAEADCVKWGGAPGLGHLVSITSQVEQDFVNELATQNVWIGATDKASEGDFVWPEGAPVLYSAYDGGEPNNNDGIEHCVEMNANGPWNDRECAIAQGYVCERGAARGD